MKNLFFTALFYALSSLLLTTSTFSYSQSFPKNFLFGTAIAGFQVDMGCPSISPEKCEDRNSDWYQFVTDREFRHPRLFIRGESVSRGPGFYETFDSDLKLVGKDGIGTNAIRISIEWSRIFPKPTFGIEGFDNLKNIASNDGIEFYHRIFASAKREGITPLVTLNHYTLPLWMHDAKACHKNLNTCKAKGWVDDRIVIEIAKYASFIGEEFGKEVDTWATLNEPFSAVVIPSYVIAGPDRSNPPGLLLHINAAKKAMKNMIEAHSAMYSAIHNADIYDADSDGTTASVGLVYVYFDVDPVSIKDTNASKKMDYFINRMFMRPFLHGELDTKWDGSFENRPDLYGKLDYLGVNYYGKLKVKRGWVPAIGYISPFLNLNPLFTKIEYKPEGIYNVITALKPYKLPILITESGVNAKKNDEDVKWWLTQTLDYTRQAIADGNDVRGYFYWSLMDNYEWNHGMDWRFGLYAIDPNDPLKARKPRSAVDAYKSIIESSRKD